MPAFDLGLLVPLAIFTAVATSKRLALGYLLGMILLVKGASMALAIAAMLIGVRALQGIDEPAAKGEGTRLGAVPA